MNVTELSSLYGIISEICKDYSIKTAGYVLATGDNVLDPLASIPDEFKGLINERQRFFSIKDKIMNEIKKKILTEIEYE